jgi:ribosome recycling factor
VGVRTARKDGNDALKQLKKDGASEDDIKRAEEDVQKLTDQFISKIDVLYDQKEKDIMTV